MSSFLPSNYDRRLKTLNHYRDGFQTISWASRQNKLNPVLNDTFDLAYTSTTKSYTYPNQDRASGFVTAQVNKILNLWKFQPSIVSYILNGVYAAHLDAQSGTMLTSQIDTSAVLYKTVNLDPQKNFDPLLMNDITNELQTSSERSVGLNGIGKVLNLFAVAGHMPSTDLENIYANIADITFKDQLKHDLQQRVALIGGEAIKPENIATLKTLTI